jgi:hypothetical protein
VEIEKLLAVNEIFLIFLEVAGVKWKLMGELLGSIMGNSWGRKRKWEDCGIVLEDSEDFYRSWGGCWDIGNC